MRCAECNLTMNRHAEKLMQSFPLKDEAKSDFSEEGFAIASIHCCPGCGKTEAVTEYSGIKRQEPGI